MKKNSMILRLLAAVLALMLLAPALCLAETTDAAELAEGADVRIMSYNILHPEWNDWIPIKGRDQRFLDILQYYMPDVVGIQEAGAQWHRFWIPKLIDTGIYSFACRKSNAEGFTFSTTTFLYNPKTVKLVDEYVLDLVPNHATRVLAVAVFEKLSDGTRFVVTNTHTSASYEKELYAQNFADLMVLAADEMKKYEGLPFFMTGDYNTDEAFEMYQTFMDTLGVKNTKYEADVMVRDHATYIGWQDEELEPNRDYCVDYIFFKGPADVKLYNVVVDHEAKNASDHLPIYADIDLK